MTRNENAAHDTGAGGAADAPYELGIVLSGGGARGIAHIGVLEALRQEGITPDCVAGTSAGALVGALYATGRSAEEMLEFFEAESPFHLSNLALGKPGFIDTQKVVAAFRTHFPDDSFAALEHKLFITATDIVSGTLSIFDSGPLVAPILASCSLPLIFTPTEIDGRWYVDGGIIDNFPVEPLLTTCRRRLGVYASPLETVARQDLKSSLDIAVRAFDLAMFFASQAKFGSCDLVLAPPELNRWGTFDTRHAREIYQAGYDAANRGMDDIRRALER